MNFLLHAELIINHFILFILQIKPARLKVKLVKLFVTLSYIYENLRKVTVTCKSSITAILHTATKMKNDIKTNCLICLRMRSLGNYKKYLADYIEFLFFRKRIVSRTNVFGCFALRKKHSFRNSVSELIMFLLYKGTVQCSWLVKFVVGLYLSRYSCKSSCMLKFFSIIPIMNSRD